MLNISPLQLATAYLGGPLLQVPNLQKAAQACKVGGELRCLSLQVAIVEHAAHVGRGVQIPVGFELRLGSLPLWGKASTTCMHGVQVRAQHSNLEASVVPSGL